MRSLPGLPPIDRRPQLPTGWAKCQRHPTMSDEYARVWWRQTVTINTVTHRMSYWIGRERDPKVVWDPDSKKWIMILTAGCNAVFESTDLMKWTRCEGKIEGVGGECPIYFSSRLMATHPR